MSQVKSSVKTTGIYLVILWLVISVGFKATGFVILPHYFLGAVNVIFMIVEIVAIIGLWTLEKWGFVLTLTILGMGIGSAMINLENVYVFSQWALIDPVYLLLGMSSVIYLIFDTVFAVYVSTLIFNK